jgi:hypothetical protein
MSRTLWPTRVSRHSNIVATIAGSDAELIPPFVGFGVSIERSWLAVAVIHPDFRGQERMTGHRQERLPPCCRESPGGAERGDQVLSRHQSS